MKTFSLWIALLLVSISALAESTRYWDMSLAIQAEKGTLDNLSVRSDGSLLLGPRLDLLQETESVELWSMARDKAGDLYAAGGSPGRIYKIGANGAFSKFFETPALVVDALAIDRQDRIYAATVPDGVIYRITPSGESSVFYDPKTKYIWALAFDSKGNLYVATGDQGEIYRVDPSGQGRLFFSSGETHIRSLLVDGQDNVYAGTDSRGMVLRIRPSGEGFVVFESPKKEITTLALDSSGNLYAAAVGDKPAVPGQPPKQPAGQMPLPPPSQPAVPPTIATANLAGGSEVYRISADGAAARLWASREEIVYALAAAPDGRLLIGSGNHGRIYRLEPDGAYTYLTHSVSSQITAMLMGPGEVAVAASNVGRVYRLRPDFAAQGSFVSEVFDAGHFSRWGALQSNRKLPQGTSIKYETRSGNTSNPDLLWSAWTPARVDGEEVFSASPPARFLQWKAVMSSSQPDRTPELSGVRGAYLPKNVAPVIEEVQTTPPGYRLPPSGAAPAQQAPQPVALQPLGYQGPLPAPPAPRPTPATTMTPEKGWVGVRWSAYDENDDALLFSVYIRGSAEKEWKLLKDGITDGFYSWDSAQSPDGTYFVKIVASDSASNPPQEALSNSREGPSFQVDNTPPAILDLKCSRDGQRLKITFRAVDAASTIQSAEYAVDGSPWISAFPVSGLSDSRQEDYNFDSADVSGGEHTVVVRVSDRFGNVAVSKLVTTER